MGELAAQIPELNPSAAGNRSLAVDTVPTPQTGHFPPPGPKPVPPEPEPDPDPEPEPEPDGPDPDPDPDPNPIPRPPKERRGQLRLKSPRVIASSESEMVLAFTPVDEKIKTIQLSVLPAGAERDTGRSIPVVEAFQVEPPAEGGKTGKAAKLPVKDGQVVLNAIPNTRFCIRVRTERSVHNMALALG